ncbi:sulfotransferase domain-containing protein [Aurantiacibacter poecillastricola]|uniref:sulfotransferase domain-containing protein n=1 Tax=Aurantiacibacter poecillastricola TaxID=3064385 RepID=UPI00273FCBB3|nr:sulfotransferase domain-containing protein [Aurantiacibacter sp. 219JJ12-13]MDP5263056.1 sulfotransferase domain-containing protein [Aurantiacibacter sp. 219JJ12-13]
MLVWIASYPKSGNTWVRAMLTAVRLDNGEELDINRLEGRLKGRRTEDFEEVAGLTLDELPREEQLRALPDLLAELARTASGLEIRKTHDAFIRTANGRNVYSAEAGARAIYIVRDPRDVAVSFAAHLGISLDAAIAEMARTDRELGREGGGLIELIGSWSSNVQSWLDQCDIPTLMISYEDLLSDPAACLAKMLGFAGLEWNEEALAQAVEMTRFDKLKAIEARDGFVERSESSDPFFRRGRAGGWREDLTASQAARIEADHQQVMCRLGYLTPLAPVGSATP